MPHARPRPSGTDDIEIFLRACNGDIEDIGLLTSPSACFGMSGKRGTKHQQNRIRLSSLHRMYGADSVLRPCRWFVSPLLKQVTLGHKSLAQFLSDDPEGANDKDIWCCNVGRGKLPQQRNHLFSFLWAPFLLC